MSLFRKAGPPAGATPRVAPVSVPGRQGEPRGAVRAASGTTATIGLGTTATIGLVVWALERWAFPGPQGLPTEVYVFVQWGVPALSGLLAGEWHRRRAK